MTDESRKDQRVKVQTLKAKYKSATVDEFIEQYARDISRGGIFIKTPKPAAQGSMLKIEIQLTDGSPVIAAVGRVVWRREAPEGGQPAGMGIKFIKIEDSSLPVIERIAAMKGPGEGPHFEDASAETTGPAAGETKSEFFGATNPAAEMPAPQDRTMMRQMSAFLGEALRSTTGADAPKTEAPAKPAEAAKPAAAARPAGPPAKKTMIGMPVPVLKPGAPASPAAESPKPAPKPAEEAKPAAAPAPAAEEPKPVVEEAKPAAPKAAEPAPAPAAAATKEEAPEDKDDDELPTTVADRRSVDQALKVAQEAAKDAVEGKSEPAKEEPKAEAKEEKKSEPEPAKEEPKAEAKEEKKSEPAKEEPKAEAKEEKKSEPAKEEPKAEAKEEKKSEPAKEEKKSAETPAKTEAAEKKPDAKASEDEGKGGNTGLIVGILVLLVVAIAGIYWVSTQGGGGAAPHSSLEAPRLWLQA